MDNIERGSGPITLAEIALFKEQLDDEERRARPAPPPPDSEQIAYLAALLLKIDKNK